MQIARVVGTVVATQKHATFEGAKLLLVQPLTLDDKPRGTALLVVDALGAGVHEKVLIVMEGRAAGEALGRKLAPVDAAVVGIIDTVDVPASPEPRSGEGGRQFGKPAGTERGAAGRREYQTSFGEEARRESGAPLSK